MAKALAGRQQLEARRALDVEGFVADIALLRKALTATDRFVQDWHRFVSCRANNIEGYGCQSSD